MLNLLQAFALQGEGRPTGGAEGVGKAGCQNLLRQVVGDLSQFLAAGMVDRNGQIICRSNGQEGPFGDLGFFRRVTAAGAPPVLLSRFHIGLFSKSPTIVAAQPTGGEPSRGMVYVSLTLGWFASLPARLPREQHMQLALVDSRDGAVLAGSPPLSAAVAARLLPNLQAAPTGGRFTWHSENGEVMLAGFAPLLDQTGSGPMVVVSSPSVDVLAAARHHRLQDVALLIVALGIAGGLAWGTGRWTLLQPLRLIGEAARRLGAGDLSARVTAPEHLAGELRALGTTLNLTAERLQRTEAANRQALDRLAQSEADYHQIADNVGDMIVRVDREMIRRYVSPASCGMLGYAPEELVGRPVSETVHPDDAHIAHGVIRSLWAGHKPGPSAVRLVHRDGRHIWAEVCFQRVGSVEEGNLIGVVRDISERHRAAALIEASEARYRFLADHITDIVTMIDHDLRRRYASPSVTAVLGYEPDEFCRLSLREVLHPDDEHCLLDAIRDISETAEKGATRTRCRYRHKNGHYVWMEGLGQLTDDGSGYVATIRDITKRVEVEERLAAANQRLERLAGQDPLTGLPNRRLLDEALPLELRRAARNLLPISLIMVDVDLFKSFNDTYGHPTGDACLRMVGEALGASVHRAADLVARYGGEEFAALLPETNEAGGRIVAERMRLAVRDCAMTHRLNPAGLVTVSLGVATIYPGSEPGWEARLLAAADQALYQAKSGGRDCVRDGAGLTIAE